MTGRARKFRHIQSRALPELIFQAQLVHRKFHAPDEVQLVPPAFDQDRRMPGGLRVLSAERALRNRRHATRAARSCGRAARRPTRAKAEGATRFCMGAAWRQAPQGREFESVLEMVRGVSALDLEVCCTLGMLTQEQAGQLKQAGLTAYNHNLDTSPEFYGNIITHARVRRSLANALARAQRGHHGVLRRDSGNGRNRGGPHRSATAALRTSIRTPRACPSICWSGREGTPLEDAEEIDTLMMVRAIATARIIMPKSRVRLAAGRQQMSAEAVTLCLLGGRQFHFYGRKASDHSQSSRG